MENSNITTFVRESTIIDSTITGRKNEWANGANLNDVEHNGKPVGTKKTLQQLDEIENQLVRTDDDLDFGEELER